MVSFIMSARLSHLLEALASHQPVDERERGNRDAIVNLLTTSREPFSRSSFDPGHITAGVFILDPAGERLLLHHHRRLGRWLQMGGHVEEGESALEAALREGREESGLVDLELVSRAIFDVDVHAIPAGRGEPDHRHFDVRYLVRTAAPDKITIDRAESNDLAWVPLGEAAARMNEEASSRAIRKISAMTGRTCT